MVTLQLAGATIEEMKQQAISFFGMEVAAGQETPAPKKPGRPPKAKVDATPVVEAPAPVEPKAVDLVPGVEAPAPPPAHEYPTPTALTLDQVRMTLQSLAAKYPGKDGIEKVSALIVKYGYKKVNAIEPKDFQAIVTEAGAL